MSKTLAERALEIAITQNGIEEMPRGSNSGPDVSIYLRSIGLGSGYAWCMAFVYWCVKKAAAEMCMQNPLIKTGGVMLQWNNTTLRKLPKTSSGIKAGDIFVMEFSHGNGHTGFVEKVEGNVVHTIEGNTNEDGSREGYEVARRTRPLSSFKGFIQLS